MRAFPARALPDRLRPGWFGEMHGDIVVAMRHSAWIPLRGLAVAVAIPVVLAGQDRLKATPGYQQAQRLARESTTAVSGGALSVSWTENGRAFEYETGGTRYRYNVASKKATEITRAGGAGQAGGAGRTADAPGRGRQFESTTSPNGALRAFYKDCNVWLSAADGTRERAITTEVFAAASASSPATDWRNYDTIYTERYMWTPQENPTGHDAASAMTYAKNLKGRLRLYYGTADNNVHPANTLQLIKGPAGSGQELRRPGRPRPRPQQRQPGPDDGILRRSSTPSALSPAPVPTSS